MGNTGKRYPSEVRARARELRRNEGWTYAEIMREFGISKGTANYWLSDVEVLIKKPRMHGYRSRGFTNSQHYREKRKKAQEAGRQMAHIYSDQGMFAMGCALYWAEGSKTQPAIQLANCDPNVIATFLHFLRTYFGVENERLKIYVQAYRGNGKTPEEVISHWADVTQLPIESVRIKMLTPAQQSRGKKHHKRAWGTCTIYVRRSGDIEQMIFGAIQEIAGIENKAWLR